MKLFKVWSSDRLLKTFVVLNAEGTEHVGLIEQLIVTASKKLDINGSKLVAEDDGTPIDEDLVLLHMKDNSTLILLQPQEIWLPYGHTLSTATTTSNSSTSSMLYPVPNPILYSPEREAQANEENVDSASAEALPVTNEVEQKGPSTFIIDCNEEYLWENFEIPWSKIATDMLNQNKSNKSAIAFIVRVIVDAMRTIKTNIPSKAFKTVARKMSQAYPKLFQDVDEEGIVVGNGYHSIYNKLMDRCNYCNRPHNRTACSNVENPIKTKKVKLGERAGASNWNPDLTDVEQETITDFDININFETTFKKTYPRQRQFLNTNPSIEEIRREWPILLKKKVVFYHFKELTKSDIDLIFNEEKINKVFQFGEKQNIAFNPSQKFLAVLKIVSTHFKEDLQFILLETEEHSTSTAMAIKEKVKTTAPIILKIETNDKYFVYLERNNIDSEGFKDFTEAFQFTFGLYFNLNLKYPNEISNTLEFIQRYFYKIHPDSGTKSKKKGNAKKRVINLMTKLISL